MGSPGVSALAALGCVGVLAWTWAQVRWFARADTPQAYFWVVLASWWMGTAALVVLLPLDLATEHSESGVVLGLWKANYWITLVWCWLVCPMVMEFWAAGEFTPRARWLSALRSNARFYLYMTAVLGAAVVLVAIRERFAIGKVQGVLLAAANAYGMLVVVVMLGYGLVQVPREAWHRVDPKRQLEWHYCRAPRLDEDLLAAQADLQEVAAQVHAFEGARLPGVADHYATVLRKADQAEAECLTDFPASRFRLSQEDGAEEGFGDGAGAKTALRHLARLHYQLKKATVRAQRAHWEVGHVVDRTVRLEGVLADMDGGGELYQRLDGVGSVGEHAELEGLRENRPGRTAQYRFWLWRAAAWTLTALSGILVWNECISPLFDRASLFALVTATDSPLLRYLCSAAPLVYMASCVYTALFKFRLLDSLALHGNRQTDVYCLLANSSYMGRLQFSLGVNYVAMLRQADVAGTLAFYNLVGDMTVVPFMGTSLTTYLPFLLVAIAACSTFRVLDRSLDALGIETHADPGLLSSQEFKELVAQGKQVVARHHARAARRAQRAEGGGGGGGGGSLGASDGPAGGGPGDTGTMREQPMERTSFRRDLEPM